MKNLGVIKRFMVWRFIEIKRLRAPRASAQNHSPLTTQFKLYLDHQSLMKKDDAVCSQLNHGDDS
ncbi:unnamed protein product [Spirodela intermedia]|uniref:Uncharacterized protein n=1 Tax=Spirodela intermedia TaxID=51605 RepID=A0A7I8JQQ4_SPIIN|nr:unnamed protein product [Spirodela intermedia]CAA6672488.1 unnamed protein product [Spirodela intermedia]